MDILAKKISASLHHRPSLKDRACTGLFCTWIQKEKKVRHWLARWVIIVLPSKDLVRLDHQSHGYEVEAMRISVPYHSQILNGDIILKATFVNYTEYFQESSSWLKT